MIDISITKHDGMYVDFTCKGHAGYADRGHDIVCAAVSILVINTANSILTFCEDKPDVISDDSIGSISIRFGASCSHDARLLMDSLVMGLTEVEREYQDFISIDIKEV